MFIFFWLSHAFLVISYVFDVLKRCGETLKIAVYYMDVDDVSVEVRCGETFLAYFI